MSALPQPIEVTVGFKALSGLYRFLQFIKLGGILVGEDYRVTVSLFSPSYSYQSLDVTFNCAIQIPGLGNIFTGNFNRHLTDLPAMVERTVESGPIHIRQPGTADVTVQGVKSQGNTILLQYQGQSSFSYLKSFEVEAKSLILQKVGALAAIGAFIATILLLLRL